MKCIGALQAFFIWIIIMIAAWMFVPEKLAIVHDNISWVAGLGLLGWWVAGYAAACDK